MTVDQSQPGNLPAVPGGSTGLEDFDTADAIIPRLTILHKEGKFKDNLSGESFERIRVVILGLVKQRILWYHQVDDSKNEQPMCKSPDHSTGYPEQNPPRGKEFPWEKAGFNPADYPVDAIGNQPLPCASCQLKEWGTHPNGKNPYCAEQWTLCVMYDPYGDDNWVPAFLTLQKSGLKPIRSYLTKFARSERPAYTEICEITLTQKQRGAVDYCTPNFIGAGQSQPNAWLEYSQNYDQMREYLTAAPGPSEDDAPPDGSDNTWNPQAQQTPGDPNDPWATAPPQQNTQAPPQAQSQQPSEPPPTSTQSSPSQPPPTPASPGPESASPSPAASEQPPPAQPSQPSQQQPPTQSSPAQPTPPSQPATTQPPAQPAPAQPTTTQPPAETPAPQGGDQPPTPPQGGTPGGSDLPF